MLLARALLLLGAKIKQYDTLRHGGLLIGSYLASMNVVDSRCVTCTGISCV